MDGRWDRWTPWSTREWHVTIDWPCPLSRLHGRHVALVDVSDPYCRTTPPPHSLHHHLASHRWMVALTSRHTTPSYHLLDRRCRPACGSTTTTPRHITGWQNWRLTTATSMHVWTYLESCCSSTKHAITSSIHSYSPQTSRKLLWTSLYRVGGENAKATKYPIFEDRPGRRVIYSNAIHD